MTHRPLSAFFRFGFSLIDFLLVVLAGLALALSLPPCALPFLAPLALVPLLVALGNKPPRVALSLGFLCGLTTYIAALWWFYPLFRWFAVPLWGMLSLFVGIFSVVFAHFQQHLGRVRALLFVPLIWTAAEFLRSEQWPLKFGWMALGYSQGNTALLALAQYVGVYGISCLLAASAALLLFAIEQRGRLSLALASVPVIVIASTFVAPPVGRPVTEPSVSVRLVQVEDNFRKALQIGGKAPLKTGTVVVLPEYALLASPMQQPNKRAQISEFTRRTKAHLLVGAIEFSRSVGDMRNYNNVALLFAPSGDLVGRYQKHHPIQFFQDGKPGRGYPVMRSAVGVLGVGICYDLDYEDVARNLVRNGAQVLLAPTADLSTWGWVQHVQHAAMMPFRAAETGRWLVRPAASGTSMVVGPEGRVRQSLGFMAIGHLDSTVGLLDHKTTYVLVGWLLPYILQGLLLAIAFATVIRLRRKRRATAAGDQESVADADLAAGR